MALIHKALCLICILNHLDLELAIFDLKGTLLSCGAPQRGALRWQELDLDNFIDSNKGNSFAACLVPVYKPVLRKDFEILRMTISGFKDDKFKMGCQQHSSDQNHLNDDMTDDVKSGVSNPVLLNPDPEDTVGMFPCSNTPFQINGGGGHLF